MENTQVYTGVKSKAMRIALAVALIFALVPMGVLSTQREAYAAENPVSTRTWEEIRDTANWRYGETYVPATWDCVAYVKYIMNNYYAPASPIVAYTVEYLKGEMDNLGATITASGTDYNSFAAAYASGAIKPGDILFMYKGSSDGTHVGIVTDQLGVTNGVDTGGVKINNSTPAYGSCRQDGAEIWTYGYGTGADKGFDSWFVYRGTQQGGHIGIIKTSSNTSITTDNDCYSLKGAVFGLYANEAHAQNDTSRLETLTTDASGQARSVNIYSFGTYYLRELTAPEGFILDTTVKSVTLSSSSADANNITWKTITNTPGNDPVGALIFKIDSETGKQAAQMGASLKGAEFTVLYYDGYYTSSGTNTGGSEPNIDDNPNGYSALADDAGPTRTWVFETNELGYVFLSNPDAYVGGDPLYYNNAGLATFLYGTYVIYESAAPTGYLLPDSPEHYLTRVIYDATNTAGQTKAINGYDHWLDPFIDLQGAVFAEIGNEASLDNRQEEEVIRGELAINKFYESEVGESHNSSSGSGVVTTPEAGIEFAFYPASEIVDEEGSSWDFSDTAQNAGSPRLKSGAVELFTLVTGSDGYASTSEGLISASGQTYTEGTGIYVSDMRAVDGTYEVRERQEGDRGGVPYGTYLAVQQNTTEKTGLASPFLVSVSAEGKTHSYVVRNTNEPSAIRVIKVDSESGLKVPYPATWSILNSETQELVEMIDDWTTQRPLTEFTSDANGDLILPEKLPIGSYELIEVLAPAADDLGYLRNPINVPFEVTEAHDWTNPIVITMSDDKPTGTLTLAKTDGVSGGAVAGAIYELRAASDIRTLDGITHYVAHDYICDLVTDESGAATVEGLHLGKYVLIEVSSPEGYAIDRTPHYVEISYVDQETAVIYETAEVVDYPTTLRVNKVASHTGSPLEGAEFKLTQYGQACYDIAALLRVMDETFISKQAFDKNNTYSYDEAALIRVITALDGKSGKITVALTVEPNTTGYLPQEAHITFSSDKTIKLEYRLIDAIIVDEAYEQDTVYYTTSDENGSLEFPYLNHGTWELEENQAPSGYVIGENNKWVFEVNADGEITGFGDKGEITIENEPTLAISTYATDKDGNKVIAKDKDMVIYDMVTYTGLTPGVECIMYGALMIKQKNADGTYLYDEEGEIVVEHLTYNGSEVVGNTTFTPEEESGSVVIEFTFDSTMLEDGTELVVYEELYLSEQDPETDEPVAEHKDPADVGQTVTIEVPEPTTPDTPNADSHAKTGLDDLSWLIPVLCILTAIALGGITYGIWRMRKSRTGGMFSEDSGSNDDAEPHKANKD